MKVSAKPDLTHIRNTSLLLGLLLVATVTLWLPAILWPFTFTWDENTFYLVASRLLQGELPYTTTFENKSPLSLLPQTGAILLVGQSPSGLRLIAALMVGLSAFLVTVLAPGVRRFFPALVTGLLMILLWVTRTNGLAWMSEVNITLLFLVTVVLLIKTQGGHAFRLISLGLLIGLIPLFRINWSFVALILFIALVLNQRSWRSLFLAGAGALVPLVVVLLTYAVDGSLERLWAGAVALPRNLGDEEGWRLPSFEDDQLPLYWLAAIAIITALMLMVLRIHQIQDKKVAQIDWIILAVSWALTLGAWIQPYDFPYQTLQIVPLVALSVGRVLEASSQYISATAVPVATACLALTYILQTQVYTQYDWRNQAQEEREVALAVAAVPSLESKSIWAPDNSNLVYFRLNKLPVTPLASMPYLVWDPGGQRAFRGEAYSEREASQYVFDLEPDLIVARDDYRGSYNGTEEALAVWQRNLDEHYRPVAQVQGHTVWERFTDKSP